MEDFKGVMLLTTTAEAEGKELDEEIKSRINLTLRCPALSSEAHVEARVWKNLTQGTKSRAIDGSWNDAVYKELGKLNLNVSGHRADFPSVTLAVQKVTEGD